MIMGEGDNGAFPFTLPFLTSKNHYCAFQTDSSPFCESSLTYEWCFTEKQYYINFKRNVRCNRHGNDSDVSSSPSTVLRIPLCFSREKSDSRNYQLQLSAIELRQNSSYCNWPLNRNIYIVESYNDTRSDALACSTTVHNLHWRHFLSQ